MITGCCEKESLWRRGVSVFLALTEASFKVGKCGGNTSLSQLACWHKHFFKRSSIFRLAPATSDKLRPKLPEREIRKKYAASRRLRPNQTQFTRQRSFSSWNYVRCANQRLAPGRRAAAEAGKDQEGMRCVGESEDERNERRNEAEFPANEPHFVISCDIGFVPSFLRSD